MGIIEEKIQNGMEQHIAVKGIEKEYPFILKDIDSSFVNQPAVYILYDTVIQNNIITLISKYYGKSLDMFYEKEENLTFLKIINEQPIHSIGVHYIPNEKMRDEIYEDILAKAKQDGFISLY